MRKAHTEKILDLARQQGVLRAKDLYAYDIPREYLKRLVNKGLLIKLARSIYALPDVQLSEHHSFAQVAATMPDSVICLLSALSYHGITTQLPSKVWVAIPRDQKRQRKIDYPPIRLCIYSEKAYEAGIEHHKIDGRNVNIYGVAKTIADCFKYRNKIGLDVALEALQDAWRQRLFTMAEVEKYAAICRVKQVMRPYLEGLVA
jgi:predicted transcriptional regulator of viral defense system